MRRSVLTGRFHAGDSFMKVHGDSLQKPTGVQKCGVCLPRSAEKCGPSNYRPTSKLLYWSAALRPLDPTFIRTVIWQQKDSYPDTISRVCRSMRTCRQELAPARPPTCSGPDSWQLQSSDQGVSSTMRDAHTGSQRPSCRQDASWKMPGGFPPRLSMFATNVVRLTM